MNITQFRAVLKAGERLYLAAGDTATAAGLLAFSHLLDEAESGTVARLVERIEDARRRKTPAPRRRRTGRRGGAG